MNKKSKDIILLVLRSTLLILILLLISLDVYTQDIKLKGYVKSNWTDEPIPAATIFISSLNVGAVCNLDGYFELELPFGTFNAQISSVGYDSKILIIDLLSDKNITIVLKESITALNNVVISSKALDENITSTEMGKEFLAIDAIKKLPSFMGEPDIVKSMLTLPGVSTVGEGTSGFNVRGGGVDQNLILQDEGLIFNPSHVFGFFSVFNPDFVKGVTLYKGNIPPAFGGRLSSVLDVKLKSGDFSTYKVNGGLGLVSSRLSVEGPIINKKLSFIVGGRIAYSDFLLSKAKDLQVQNSSASFSDSNLKLSYLLNNDKIEYSGYISNDGFSFSLDTVFHWATSNHVVKWIHTYNEKLSSKAIASLGNYQYDIKDENGINAFEIKSIIKYHNYKYNLEYLKSPKLTVNVGADIIAYKFQPGITKARSSTSAIKEVIIETEKSIEAGIFVDNKIKLSDELSIQVGARYSLFYNLGDYGTDFLYEKDKTRSSFNIIDTIHYSSNEVIKMYSGFEPRLSVRYQLNNESSLKFSYNKNRQYLHLISNTTSVTPTDTWKTSNLYLPPEIGNQFSLGFFKNFKENQYETSLESYYKTTRGIIDYKDGTVLLSNENIEADLITGIGKSFGLEFYIKKNKGRLTGWLSYTYSRSLIKFNGNYKEEKINSGKFFPSNFDKPYDFSTSISFKFTRVFFFSTNFTFNTGRPLTAPTSQYSISNLTAVGSYSERNQFRIPNYHRLDISFTVESKPRVTKKYHQNFTFSIYNLYGRKNAFSVFFKNQKGTPPSAYKLSVLGSVFPSVSYNFNF